MTVAEAIDYINTHTWSQWKLGLSRTEELLRLLGNPQKQLRFVHVAGSNGKGSTCAMVERILREAGYVTGFYPSPYIEDFRERIQVCGEYITEEALCRITARVRDAADSMEDHPSQFEIITAIGMVYFAEKKCDLVVLEVGLGGTYDSTNIIDAPEAAVITNIGLEHTEYLGSTLAEIAGNKCGIIKSGADVVCYENVPEVMEVVRRTCAEKGCPLHIAGFDRIQPLEKSFEGQYFRFLPRKYDPAEQGSRKADRENTIGKGRWESCPQAAVPGEQGSRKADRENTIGEGRWESCPQAAVPGEQGARKAGREDAIGEGRWESGSDAEVFRLSLLGDYQLHNAATALTVVETLQGRGWRIPPEAVRRGLARVQWPARFEVLSRDPLFILDGGHNPQCAEALAQSLREYLTRKVIFLMGMLADKDYEKVIETVAPFAAGFVCLTPDSPRALSGDRLAAILRDRGFSAQACGTAEEGIRTALRAASGVDPLPVVAFGSLYMAGAVRHAFPRVCGEQEDKCRAFSAETERDLKSRQEILACKKKQREEALAARRALTEQERADKSGAVCRILMSLPELQKAQTVFSYAATWDEVNLDAVNQWLEDQGKTVCYPVTGENGTMKAVLPGAGVPGWQKGEGRDACPAASAVWRTGVFGIREPVEEAALPVDPGQVDAVLVPCVVFDRQGGRCGHGAGYYDRWLAQLPPRVPRILIAFDVQETAEVAVEETDVRMDLVVTESGVVYDNVFRVAPGIGKRIKPRDWK